MVTSSDESIINGRLFRMSQNKLKKRRNTYVTIFQHHYMLFFFTILFNVSAAALGVFVAVFLQQIIDISMANDIGKFKRMVLISVLYLCTYAVIYYVYSILSKILLKNITSQLRHKMFQGIFRRNDLDYNRVNTADYISAQTNDIKLVEENYIIPLLVTTEYLVTFITTLYLLLKLNSFITLLLFFCMIIMFIIPGTIGKLLQSRQTELSNQYSSFTAKIKDMFSGFEVIKSFQIFNKVESDYISHNKQLADKKYQADKLLVINQLSSQFLALSTQIITIFIAAYFVMRGDITVGTLIAIIQLAGSFVMPLIVIMQNIPLIQSISPILKRVDDLSNYTDTSFSGRGIADFQKNIKMTDVSFSYYEDKPVLNGVNLSLEKGKKYALVGESGCGKSTLVKLILGNYANYYGKIHIDNAELKDCDIETVKKNAAIIHQNVYMFDSTVKENICLYENYSDDILNQVLETSGVNKFLTSIQDEINCNVGENGGNLSGGQRQRIAIARALIRNTPFLILDEGTSAIDEQTSQEIEKCLLDNNSLTLITITHNLKKELLRLYDEVIYMEHGEVLEMGSYDELYCAKGRFYQFCN